MASHQVLFDGDWGFWRRGAAWFRRKDLDGRLQWIAYQQAPSPPMTPELRAACRLAVHVLTTNGRTLRAGRAALFLVQEFGWPVAPLFLPPLVWFVEIAYWLVAKNRAALSRWMFTEK